LLARVSIHRGLDVGKLDFFGWGTSFAC